MIIGLIAAALSAICYGVASVLQASSARKEHDTGGIDARLLARLAKQGPFLVGIALDVIAFAAQFVALRYLAVFVVQAVQAGNLAVTAVVAIPVLGARLAGREWAAIAGVCGGLVLLALAAGSERVSPVGEGGPLGAARSPPARSRCSGSSSAAPRPGSRRSILGLVAGLGFGVVALGARVLTDLSIGSLIGDPAAYAVLIGGFVSFLLYTTAIQRYAVTTVTAAVVVGETRVAGAGRRDRARRPDPARVHPGGGAGIRHGDSGSDPAGAVRRAVRKSGPSTAAGAFRPWRFGVARVAIQGGSFSPRSALRSSGEELVGDHLADRDR